jgi:hypothetical protein
MVLLARKVLNPLLKVRKSAVGKLSASCQQKYLDRKLKMWYNCFIIINRAFCALESEMTFEPMTRQSLVKTINHEQNRQWFLTINKDGYADLSINQQWLLDMAATSVTSSREVAQVIVNGIKNKMPNVKIFSVSLIQTIDFTSEVNL